MFVILLIASTFTQGLTIVSNGNSFITAFPENLGYFYPYNSIRSLSVTALQNDTAFTIFYDNIIQQITIPQIGATTTVTFPKTVEVHQLSYYANSIRITSSKNIVVHSFSQAYIGSSSEKSIQAYVVQPITNLGTQYLIPSLYQSDIIQTFGGTPAASGSQRYSSFKLIIINAEDVENTVVIVQSTEDSVQEDQYIIPPYQLIQLEASPNLMVKSSNKVAVMQTHPCLENTTSCRCNLIVNQILPTRFQGQNFVVPYVPDITQSRLLMTSDDKTISLSQNNVQLQPSSSGFLTLSDQTQFQYVTASGNVSLTLISPGLIIELIPENMFAACYVLHFNSDGTGTKRALVIAETLSRDKVHKQDNVITTGWTTIDQTKYSSNVITLTKQTNFIWHPSSKIGVYMLDKIGTAVYGGPAIPINDKPDESGCLANPEQFEVGDESLSWAESLAYCTSLQKQLACPTNEDIQIQLSAEVNATENEEAWIGLRRSLLTTDWYWQNQISPSSSVDYFQWADGQPQDVSLGLCASLSLDRKDDFKWKSAKCCEKKRPICYSPPTFLTMSENLL